MFLETLFEPSESICLGRDHREIATIPFSEAITRDHRIYPFFCINPLGGPRRDKNCSVFRNFLVEFDGGLPLGEQIPYVKGLGMPYTTVTYSGGKSYHFIISLIDPVDSKSEYNQIARWLLKVFPIADQTTSNPSRLSRLAGAIRPDNGRNQTLEEVKARVAKLDLINWLESKVGRPRAFEPKPLDRGRLRVKQQISYESNVFLLKGASPGKRNTELFKAACNLAECGYDAEEIFNLTKHIERNDSDIQWFRTIESAVARVLGEKEE